MKFRCSSVVAFKGRRPTGGILYLIVSTLFFFVGPAAYVFAMIAGGAMVVVVVVPAKKYQFNGNLCRKNATRQASNKKHTLFVLDQNIFSNEHTVSVSFFAFLALWNIFAPKLLYLLAIQLSCKSV